MSEMYLKKILIVAIISTVTSTVNAEYRGLIEYGLSGVENHDATGSPKIGLQYNSGKWGAEISWRHWFSKDGSLSNTSSLVMNKSYYGQNIYSVDLRRVIYNSGKSNFYLGSGFSALEMQLSDSNRNISVGYHRALINFSGAFSYKLTQKTNFHMSVITALDSITRPTYGSFNVGLNRSF